MTEWGSGTPSWLGPGSRVAGYLIEEQIGAGGMAIVFRARDEMLGRAAALKVMSPRIAADDEFRARFIRESRSIATVDDPHIIPVYAAGDADGVLYIATRYIPGGDLEGVLASNGGFLPPDRTAALITQVASALDAAHAAGLVHRDVKLANILVETMPGRPEHAYLSDFGLTKGTSATTTGLTAVGQFMGTPDYCAPEQITGAPVNSRTDQYALACAAFAMLTGAPPYQRPEPVAALFAHLNEPIPAPSSRRAGVPAAVDAVISRGLAKAPEDRYASCGEFAAALRDAVTPREAPAPAVPLAPVVSPAPAAPSPARQQLASSYVPPAPAYTPLTPAYAQAPSYAPPPPYTPPAAPYPQPAAAPYPQPVSYSPPASAYVPPGGYSSPAAGYIPPAATQDSGGTPPAGRPRRKKGLIAGALAVAVLAAAGTGTALALNGSKPNPPHGHGGTGGALAYTGASVTAPFSAPGNNIGEASFSQDGKLLVTDEFNSKSTVDSFYVWDAASHERLRTLAVPGDYVTASTPVISADDKTVTEMAIRSYPDSIPVQVYRWDLATGKRTTIFAVNSPFKTWGAVFGSTTLSGDGSELLIETAGGHATDVWDVNNDVKIATLTQPGSSPIVGVVVSSDGSVAGISDTSGTTYVWNVASQSVIRMLHFTYKAPASGSAPTFPGLSPDGKQVIVYGNGGAMTLWDVATGANVTPRGARWVTQTGWMYSPDGKVLASQGKTPTTLDLWNAATGAHLLRVTFPPDIRQWAYAMSADDKMMMTVSVTANDSQTGTFFLWNLR